MNSDGKIEHPEFDEQFYIEKYPDVISFEGGPLQHYLLYGKYEGRFPCKKYVTPIKFDESFYTTYYRDVKNSTKTPFEHYKKYGIQEGRHPFPFSKENFISFNDILHFDKIVEKSIAVHAHVFYIDLLEELVEKLQNIPFPYSLFISTSSEDNQIICYKRLAKLVHLQNLDVQVVPNRGRNFYPLFKIFKDVLQHFDFICHIHTKKSLSVSGYTYGWREYLWHMLLGSKEIIKKTITLLNQPECGLVFPEPYYLIDEQNILLDKWLKKFSVEHKQYMFNKCNIAYNDKQDHVHFPVGGMFWAKSSALKNVFDLSYELDDFIEENHDNNDGSLAHFLERFIGLFSLNSGHINYIITNDHACNKYEPIEIATKNGYNRGVRGCISKKIFNSEYYLDTNLDVASKKIHPLDHYLEFGMRGELRRPVTAIPRNILLSAISLKKCTYKNDVVDLLWYLSSYYKIGEVFLFSDINPYKHYEEIGANQGKLPNIKIFENFIHENPELCENHNDIKVSIIIPVYNSSRFLVRCLNSVLAQTMKDIEIIIVNDGSEDISQLIIDEYVENNNISCIVHHQNIGLVKTHKDGIAQAKGTYFAIVDGDDWIDSKFCEIMYSLAKAYNAELISCKHIRATKNSGTELDHSVLMDMHILEGENIANAIGYPKRDKPDIHYGLNRKLHHRETWLQCDPLHDLPDSLVDSEDHIATTRYCKNILKVICIKNPLYFWYINNNSVTFSKLDSKKISERFLSLKTTYAECDCVVHDRNIRSILLFEMYPILLNMYDTNKEYCKDTLMLLAGFVDTNRHIFSYETFVEIKKRYIPLFSDIQKSLTKKGDTILFLDPHGMTDLKKYFLPYWNSRIPSQYIQLDDAISMLESFKNIENAFSAKIIVTSGGWDKKLFQTNRPTLQLWHGMGALKKVPAVNGYPVQRLYCSSKNSIYAYTRMFSLKDEQVFPYGTVQADYFLDNENMSINRELFYTKYPSFRGKKTYIWCPTFRRSNNGKFYGPPLFDIQEMSEQLNEEIFIYKLHPVLTRQMKNDPEYHTYFQNENSVICAEDCSIEELISVADVFMTDYSSSIFYAVLRNIPLVMYAPDINTYQYNPGLEIDYMDSMPGDIITSKDHGKILEALRNATSDTDKYRKFKEFHLGSCDGFSRERIMADITSYYFSVD